MAEPAGEQPGRRARPRRERRQRPFWQEFAVMAVVAVGLALLIKTFLVQPFYIPSESMETTLLRNDRVLVSKLAYRWGEVERGDVIVFNGGGSWQPGLEPDEGRDYIKRVIGLPGDRVACCDAQGRVTVNGRPLVEDYLYPQDRPSLSEFSVTVPPGRLWVMGDHRSASADSRAHTSDPGNGTIPLQSVVGRAFIVIWPPNRIGLLSPPPAFEKVESAPAASGEAAEVGKTAEGGTTVELGKTAGPEKPEPAAQAPAHAEEGTR